MSRVNKKNLILFSEKVVHRFATRCHKYATRFVYEDSGRELL